MTKPLVRRCRRCKRWEVVWFNPDDPTDGCYIEYNSWREALYAALEGR